ncbi:nitrogenase molybdenum-iron protein beta chain [Solidesulfovibrio carbinoliphilus subsp. oakridgensis]|uniref:Nitrogenase molybdenum-iron protein beta chain n=1 Tax=Solidesulfovibrio carbinoliphilus subsp. oakridgensis TaxID=694327 RepID=G7QDI2_9BACT|nr:nitrogenase molybdenum-iron protein subunit beta [Solidesulfovibrio carbinoliphilus]EHJ46488.1 nitrogenase molybdenum-iron protein beta chain [Solidesulfovibrio carbinoliphilus subsp. oakridgensis]
MALLRHTTGEIKERSALTVNPAKTCQPVGAMYAALGVHGCFPHSHGSQGCCAYHRSALTRHYKEPVVAGTSSFTEGSSVFGGQSNLISAIDNIFTLYDPETIAIHTTCLSETIGDDLRQISQKAIDDGKVPAGKHIVYANTPSYIGTHVTGYANMVKGIVKGFTKKSGTPNGKVNIIPGFCEPSDMAEFRRIAGQMGVEILMAPDTNGVLNGPLDGHYQMYPKGGATVEEITSMGDSVGTLGLGRWATTDAVNYLDSEFKVPGKVLGLPIGLKATDRFVNELRLMSGTDVPESINFERGQVVDIISDYSQYFYGKKVTMAGDPDQLLALVEFVITLGMIPAYTVTGTSGKYFDERMKELLKDVPYDCKFKSGGEADMYLLHQWIKNDPVDLLIGNTYLKYIARDEDTPLVRHGFPILDRVGHQYFPTVGYAGAMRLMEKFLGAIMDREDRDAPETKFELQM